MVISLAESAQQEILFSNEERVSWLRLIRSENIGPITFNRLLSRYGSATKALEALPDLALRGGRSKPTHIFSMEQANRETEQLDALGGRMICACEPDYPELLSKTEDAPPVISVLGNTDLIQKPCLAMVGARNASLNGRRLAQAMAREIAQGGYTVVSGLARGIDTAAHAGSLDHGTVAVVAGGVDVVYPQENTDLYNQIKERGLVIAESPLGTQPIARHFPKRNRIVSGMSLGTVVVEATQRSGSLITARLAGEQGREVMAVPGFPADPRARGPNNLIRDGAALVQDARDVIQSMEMLRSRTIEQPGFFDFHAEEPPLAVNENLDDTENAREKVLAILSPMPVAVDDIIAETALSVSMVLTVLLELELAGKIERKPGNRVNTL